LPPHFNAARYLAPQRRIRGDYRLPGAALCANKSNRLAGFRLRSKTPIGPLMLSGCARPRELPTAPAEGKAGSDDYSSSDE